MWLIEVSYHGTLVCTVVGSGNTESVIGPVYEAGLEFDIYSF